MKINATKTSALFAIIGVFLLYTSYRNISFKEVQEELVNIRFKWVFFATISHLLNHLIRSYRWSLMLRTQRQHPPLYKVYLAEMTGFFFNGIPGRLGEINRCYGLASVHGTPVKQSLATVIVERGIDILFFGVFFLLSLFFYFTAIKDMTRIALEKAKAAITISQNTTILFMIIVGLGLMIVWLVRNVHHLMPGVYQFFYELWYAIKATLQANSLLFWVSTTFIFLFYFLLEYLSLFSLKATANLTSLHGITPAICVFVALNLSHILPVGHGGGLYHLLATFALGIFGVTQQQAFVYASITYFIQLFNSFVIGGICMLISFRYHRKTKQTTH